MLKEKAIRISMDGKGRWADNIYIERFWRSIKYELANLLEFETAAQARAQIANYIDFYNNIRPHQTLKYRTPNQVYWEKNNELVDVKKYEDQIPFIAGALEVSQIFELKLS